MILLSIGLISVAAHHSEEHHSAQEWVFILYDIFPLTVRSFLIHWSSLVETFSSPFSARICTIDLSCLKPWLDLIRFFSEMNHLSQIKMVEEEEEDVEEVGDEEKEGRMEDDSEGLV